MKLVEKNNGYEIHDLENGYTVVKEKCSWNSRGFKLTVRADRDTYLPDIYDNSDSKDLKTTFTVQTTAYGSMEPEEILKVIEGYKTALEAVEILKSNF